MPTQPSRSSAYTRSTRNARNILHAVHALALAAASIAAPAFAQAGASGDIELGANSAGSYDSNASAPAASTYRSSSDPRLALQIRLDALTMVGAFDDAPVPGSSTIGRKLLVPVAALGVRLIDTKLFLGAGLSFYGWSVEEANGDEVSRSGFGLHPVVTYDLLRESAAALSLNGAVNIASLGETEACGGGPGGCADLNDDVFGLGLSLGIGLRGMLLPGLAIGGDFGWGFLSTSSDNDDSLFVHGLYAALLVEASVGI